MTLLENKMITLLNIIANLIKNNDRISFVDTFENRKEIWFNWDGKTYKLVLSEIS